MIPNFDRRPFGAFINCHGKTPHALLRTPYVISSSMRLPTGWVRHDPASSSRDFRRKAEGKGYEGRHNVDDWPQASLAPSLLTSGGGGFHDTTIRTWTR